MPFDLLASRNYINEISIYENKGHYYFIGKHYAHKTNLIFTILKENFEHKQRGKKSLKDLLEEHKKEYDDKSLEEFLRKLNQEPHTKLKKIEDAICIFGFVKFYYNYYAILVIECSRIGKIGEFVINRADKIKMLPLFTIDHKTSDFLELENKYLTIFKNFEISRQTYFSFNYNLTKTLQRNFIEKMKGELIKNYNKNFCNYLLINSETNEILEKDDDENCFQKFTKPNFLECETIPRNSISNFCNSNNNLNTLNNTIITNPNDNSLANNLNINRNCNLNGNINMNSNSKYNHANSSSNYTYVKRRSEIKKLTQNIFLWNHFHIKEFFNLMENKIWCIWFIYGFFEQVECLIYGQRYLVTVISRRNRKFAGTRYLKRGINDEGEVANDVETEQILEEISTSCPEKPIISSYVHIRGSVPIYWYQEQNGILPKPDIKVNHTDVFYESTTRHFMKLMERYGEPTVVCNLTKKKEEHKQETLLNECYLNSVEYILKKLNYEEDLRNKEIEESKDNHEKSEISKKKLNELYSSKDLEENLGSFFKKYDSNGISNNSSAKKKFICFKNEKIKSDIKEFNKFLSNNFNYKNLDLFSNKINKNYSQNNNNQKEEEKSLIINPRKNDIDNQNYVINFLKDIDDKIDNKILYCHYDLKQERRSLWFYYNFYLIAYNFTEITNMFSFIPHLRCNNTYLLELQKGIIRSNCVDCLDRTNVFQQVIGTAVMVSQLRLMGLDVKEPNNEDEEIFGALTELYKKMGHVISTQYAGSQAHKQTIKDNRTKINKFMDKIPELLNTCKRYFNNSFNDQYKQMTINLFLGKYKDFPNTELSDDINKHIWDLATDQILHRSKKRKEIPRDWVSTAAKKYETYSLITDLYELYEKYEVHLNQNKLKDKEMKRSFLISDKPKKFTVRKLSGSFINQCEENENEFYLKKEIIDLISITRYQNNNNKYIFDLSKYNKKIKKSNPEFITFGLLDIDPKVNIKFYQNFNYTKLYPKYLQELENDFDRTFNTSNQSPNGRFRTSSNQFNSIDGKLKNDGMNDSSEKKIGQPGGKKPKREKLKPRELNKLENPESKVNEPKYNLKFTFDLDENDFNMIRDFNEPDIKFRGGEYNEQDEFLKIEIEKENFDKIFDRDLNYEPNLVKEYYNNNCNEYKEDLRMMLSNTNPKKVIKKPKKTNDKDYLIYDVARNIFYRKNFNAGNIDLTTNFGENQILQNHYSMIYKKDKNKNLDSPKTEVKVNRLPLKIIEDYII